MSTPGSLGHSSALLPLSLREMMESAGARAYDGTVIDPIWLDRATREVDLGIPPMLHAKLRLASITFQLGDWRRKWREAADRNDFAMLDYLDRQFEMIGV